MASPYESLRDFYVNQLCIAMHGDVNETTDAPVTG
jgi:hypothetical protein